MTPYTISYYRKIEGQWIKTTHEFKEETLDDAQRIYRTLMDGVIANNVQLEAGMPATPYIPQHKKNTNAWKPRKYG